MLRPAVALTAAGALVASLAAAGSGHSGRTTRTSRTRAAVVWIDAGEFVMGASPHDLGFARRLCEREPLARDPDFTAVQRCLPVPLELRAEPLCDGEVFQPEQGAHRVWLPPFGIDRTEVTVGAYDRCVAVGVCRAARVTPGTPQFGGLTQPVVGVSWEMAQTYCRWAGGRLPTEAEWERAARGRDGRRFPWGEQYDPRRANHGTLAPGCHDDVDGFALTAPVGSYPDGASPEGVLDMAGNVWEWVADLWDGSALYPREPGARRVDPRGASHGARHIIRGGSYGTPAMGLRTTWRGQAGTAEQSFEIGFRCAYDREPR
jgi:formylglycine-generating enzyme required for sulfatase activity